MATFTVREGDTLGAIADMFGTSADALAAENNIPNPDFITVGQVLVVPGDDGDENGQIDPGRDNGESSGISAPYAELVPLVQAAADQFGVEAALIMGVISAETDGRNILGADGHGRGLMQIDDRFHAEWVATHNGGFDPPSNILKGTEILRDNINAFGGNVKHGVSAYNAGVGGAQSGIDEKGDSDAFTTGHNYSVKVFERRDEFRAGGLA